MRVRQLEYPRRRVLVLVRALRTFYLLLGAFAAASLISVMGAVFVMVHLDLPRHLAVFLAIVCGTVGVAALVSGSALLVWESRLTLAILAEETNLVVRMLRSTESAEGRWREGGRAGIQV